MAVSASAARANLFGLIKEVNEEDEAVEIVSTSGGSAMLVPARQWAEIQETLHLLRTPKNAMRLLESIENVRNGIGVEAHELIPDTVDAQAS